MTLSELIMQYCNDHGLSVRKFAEKTGLSHAYIHFIIKGRNPKTGRPLSGPPTSMPGMGLPTATEGRWWGCRGLCSPKPVTKQYPVGFSPTR